MKLITHSMHWGWKVSFSLVTLVLATTWVNQLAAMEHSYIDEEAMVLCILPLAIWLTVRWIVIGTQAKAG
jgi:hypothetical protein